MSNCWLKQLALASAMLWLLTPAAAQDTWLGKKIFLKEGVKPRLNDKEVDPAAIAPFPVTVTGVDGKKLLLGQHWVYANEVLTLEQQAVIHRVRAWAMSGRREFDQALAEYEKSRELNSNDPQLYLSRAQTRLAMKQADLAFQDFTEAIRLAPRSPDAYQARASAYLAHEKIDEAIQDFSTLIELQPIIANHYISRASAYRKKGDWNAEKNDLNTIVEKYPRVANNYLRRGQALQKHGELDAALADFDKMIEFYPHYLDYYQTRAVLLKQKGDPSAAKDSFNKLIEFRSEKIKSTPENPATYDDRGLVFKTQGDYAAAIKDFDKAIELDKSFAQSLNNRAWLRATCPSAEFRSGKQAIEDATRACELTNWQNASYLDTLAAAYAEAGDYDKAIEWETKVLGMFQPGIANLASSKLFRADVEARLASYRQQQPLREE
jgi:tetratricopeptide (TPR) repeat protein